MEPLTPPAACGPKAKAKVPPSAPTTPIDLELEDEVESWDQVQEEGEMMQLRDEPNMEMVMQEVLCHLRRTAGENMN